MKSNARDQTFVTRQIEQNKIQILSEYDASHPYLNAAEALGVRTINTRSQKNAATRIKQDTRYAPGYFPPSIG